MRTLTGLASNAISPRKDVSEMEETSVQKVGTRDYREKNTYESYTSRELTKSTPTTIIYTYIVDLERLHVERLHVVCFIDRNACRLLDVALIGRNCCELRRGM
jgi:hypothetical protein